LIFNEMQAVSGIKYLELLALLLLKVQIIIGPGCVIMLAGHSPNS
jgi:hypothetical protein